MEALWRVMGRLGATNPKQLATAILESAAEEMDRNDRFIARVQTQYQALSSAMPAQRRCPRQPRATLLQLTPIKHATDVTFDIGAPPDPYLSLEYFGASQLPIAL